MQNSACCAGTSSQRSFLAMCVCGALGQLQPHSQFSSQHCAGWAQGMRLNTARKLPSFVAHCHAQLQCCVESSKTHKHTLSAP